MFTADLSLNSSGGKDGAASLAAIIDDMGYVRKQDRLVPIYARTVEALLTNKRSVGDREGALALSKRLVSLDPNHYRYWLDYYFDLSKLGRRKEADDALERAYRIAPYAYYAVQSKVDSLLSNGDRAGARSVVKRYLSAARMGNLEVFWASSKRPPDWAMSVSRTGSSPYTPERSKRFLLTRGQLATGKGRWPSRSVSFLSILIITDIGSIITSTFRSNNRAHCDRTGQVYNAAHSVDDFSLDYLKGVLRDISGIEIVHEEAACEIYSFEIVIKKTGGVSGVKSVPGAGGGIGGRLRKMMGR